MNIKFKTPIATNRSKKLIGLMFVTGCSALCLPSCVAPYEPHRSSSVTVTHYRPGYQVATLPGGYRREVISGQTYYYHDGYYYRPSSGGYVIVDAPRSSRYYDDYGRRHQVIESDRRHEPYYHGEVITRLPDGYRVVKHRQNTFYQVGDRYYRRDNDRYVIVERPY